MTKGSGASVMGAWGRSRLRRAAGQRGAVIVEAALILPILIMLAIGIFEFGLWLSAKNIVTNASGTAARVASALPKQPSILREAVLKADAEIHPRHDGDVIIVFEANPDGSLKGGGSLPGGCNTQCARFTRVGKNNPIDPTTYDGSFDYTLENACGIPEVIPSSTPTTAWVDERSWIGVYVSVKFDVAAIPWTDVVTPDHVSHQVVYRLEPVPSSEVCLPE